MATNIFDLAELNQNWYMTWYMSTQAGNNIIVTLNDNASTYVDQAQRQSTEFGVLSEGFAQVQGTSMQLTVNIPAATTIQRQQTVTTLTNPVDGTPLGQGYVISYEDSDDHDFNDLSVMIMSWASEG